MTKFRASLILLGCIILCVAGALAAFFTMSASGFITSEPIEIVLQVDDSEKVYDGTPLLASNYQVVSGELLNNHEFKISYTGSQTDVGSSACGMDVKVLDNSGRDVTNNYALKITEGRLAVTPRSIVAVQENVVCEYDGEPNVGGDYFDLNGDLCNGHRLVRVFNGEVSGAVNVGEYEDRISEPRIYDANGIDVTYNYGVAYTHGRITVERRKLRLELVSVEKVYDGVTVAPSYIIAEGSLVSDDSLDVRFTVNDQYAPAFNMTKPDSVTVGTDGVQIFDKNGLRVTENYAVSFTKATATLSITPRALRVVGVGGSWVYDGYSHDTNNLTQETMVTGLCGSDEVEINYTAEIKDVGVKVNTFTVSVFSGGMDMDDCYDIDYVEKNIEVTPLTVTLNYRSETEKTYDGAALVLDLNALADGSDSLSLDGEYGNEYSLKDECWSDLILNSEKNMVNAGSYNYSVTLNENSNFKLSVAAAGVATINPKPIKVYIEDEVSDVYNGEIFSFLPKDVASTGEPEEIGYLTLSVENGAVIKNAGEYVYTLRIDATRENSRNYVVEGNPSGIITINPKHLSVTAGNVSKTYTGSQINLSVNEAIEKTTATEAEKVFLKVNFKTTARDVSVYDFTIEVDGTDNFELDDEAVEGTLTVTPKVINVTPLQVTRVYSGESFGFGIDDLALTTATAEEKNIFSPNYGYVCDAGSYGFNISVSNENYILSGATSGTITVNPRPVNIVPKNAERTYNGNEQSFGLNELIKNYTELGDAVNFITAVTNKTVKDADSYTFTFLLEGTNNYVLSSAAAGSITVNPKSVALNTRGNVPLTYDGSVHSFTVNDVVNDSNISSELTSYLTVSTDKVVQNAGSYKFTVKVEGTNNYVLTNNTGNITVNPKTISFAYKDIVREYTGSNFTFTLEDAADGTLTSEQRDNLTLSVTDTVTDAGYYTYTIELKSSATNNYSFESESGNIRITPKRISVTAKDVERVYSGTSVDLTNPDEFIITSVTDEEKNKIRIGCSSAVINVGSYTFTATLNDGINNYELTGSLTGTIKITPKPIIITLKQDIEDRVYSGDEQTLGLNELITSIDGKAFDPGSEEAKYLKAICNGVPRDVGTYTYEIVVSNTQNYVISGEAKSSFGITPVEVLLKYKDDIVTKVYDGKPLSFDMSKFTLTAEGIEGLYVAQVTADMDGADVGNKILTVTGIVIRMTGTNEDVSKNFMFVEYTIDGIITKRTITIKATSVTMTLDEYYVNKDNIDWDVYADLTSDSVLADGDVITVYWSVKPGNNSDLIVNKDEVVIEHDGVNVTSNYEIKPINGKIILTY